MKNFLFAGLMAVGLSVVAPANVFAGDSAPTIVVGCMNTQTLDELSAGGTPIECSFYRRDSLDIYGLDEQTPSGVTYREACWAGEKRVYVAFELDPTLVYIDGPLPGAAHEPCEGNALNIATS